MPLAFWLLAPAAAGFALLWAWEAGRGARRIGYAICLLWWGVLLYAAASPRARFFGPVFYRARTDAKLVALTFDDGPNEPVTSRLLDLLKKEGVPATFFLVGKNARTFPETVRRIAREGHDVGNHTYRHLPLPLLSGKAMGLEIDRAQAILTGLTGRAPRLLRPPFGLRDERVLASARARGLLAVGWSVWGKDPFTGRMQRPAAEIVRNVEGGLEPGAVILLHDGDMARAGVDKIHVLPAVARLIPELRARGYRFVTLSQMLGAGETPPSNAIAGGEDARLYACALAAALQWAAAFLFWPRLKRRARAADRWPAVAVVVACKGYSEDLGDNISSFLRQDYGGAVDYFFVVPSRQDPAYLEVDRILAAEREGAAKLLVSDARPSRCSEQNLNLLRAYESLPARSEIILFADCDVRAPAGWIRELVSGLETGPASVASAAALYVPQGAGWGGLLRLLWQSVGLAYLPWAPVVTGSSMALRRKDFVELGMEERWKKDATADAALDRAARRAGKKIVFLPAAMPVARADCPLRESFAQFNKWVWFCRLYARPLWLAGALAVAGNILLWAWVLRAPSCAACVALLLLGDVLQAYFILRIMLREFPDRFTRLYPMYRRYPMLAALAAPLLLPAYAVNFLASVVKEKIAWGGYVYRIRGPGQVDVVG